MLLICCCSTLLKCSERVYGIVEEGSRHKKQRGWGGLLWLQVHCALGMGRLIAVHFIRGFKAHGLVHRRQFAYRGFFSIFINGTSSSPNRCFRTWRPLRNLCTIKV